MVGADYFGKCIWDSTANKPDAPMASGRPPNGAGGEFLSIAQIGVVTKESLREGDLHGQIPSQDFIRQISRGLGLIWCQCCISLTTHINSGLFSIIRTEFASNASMSRGLVFFVQGSLFP